MLPLQKESETQNSWFGRLYRLLLNSPRTLRGFGIAAFVLVIGFFGVPWRAVFGQATVGYSLLATVNAPTVTYTDSTCPTASSCSYEVTAVDAQGESVPGWTGTTTGVGNQNISAIPGPQGKIILTWSAPSTGTPPTAYKVYTTARVPNPPTGLAAASN